MALNQNGYYDDVKQSGGKLAVKVRDVRVSYGRGSGKQDVLRGLSLTVQEGYIYGLLGPSGCGKTTLLRCIVGLLTPKDGCIRVFGTQPGTPWSSVPGYGVGYMPQELALYSEFTIEETLLYFGHLYRMDKATLLERTCFLLGFLDLPDKKKLVKNLSGGQKRRVSLAAALIHRPPLLILDEPTVGVDPLLRQSIWRHLVTLTKKENMSVIITTHYIEEARQANTVGLMRQGRLLAESNPEELLRKHHLPTLEDVFLHLCRGQSLGDVNEDLEAGYSELPNGKVVHQIFSPKELPDIYRKKVYQEDNGYLANSIPHLVVTNKSNLEHTPPSYDLKAPHMCAAVEDSFVKTMALLSKNITRVRRNPGILVFQFLLPALQVILFCWCIGQDPFDLPLAILNQENPPTISENYLEHISSHTVIKKNFTDVNAAFQSVVSGDTWGVVTIGENFTENLRHRFEMGMDADNATVNGSNIRVYLDMTNQQVGYTLQKTLITAFEHFTEDMFKTLGRNPAVAKLPVSIEDPIYGQNNAEYTEFMAPGVILSITFFMAVGLTAMSFILERKEGLLDRSWVAGVTPIEVLISHALMQFLVLVVQVGLLLMFHFLVFSLPSRGPIVWVVVLTLLQGCCGMAYGLVISALCTEENSAIMLALGSFYPNLLLSGIVWPVQAMPHYIRYVSYCLPQTLPTESMRFIISKGWDITQRPVWLGFLVSIGWLDFLLIMSALIFRIRK